MTRLIPSDTENAGSRSPTIDWLGSFAGEVLGASVGVVQLALRLRRELSRPPSHSAASPWVDDPCQPFDPVQARRDELARAAAERQYEVNRWKMVD